jgi:arabinofuranan 3-O-arabinosyltransferase
MEGRTNDRSSVSTLPSPSGFQSSLPPQGEGASASPSSRSRLASLVLGPIGALLFLEQIRSAAMDPHLGADILTFRHAAQQFLQHSSPYPVGPQVNPFIFPPSALLFFLPLAFLSASVVVGAYLVIQSAAILFAGAFSLRIFGVPWRSAAGAAVVFGSALYVGMETNLAFSNVNGILVLAEASFLYLACRDRWDWAGVALGCSLALKPSLVLLLLVPLLWRHWRSFGISVGIPIGLSLVVLPFLPRTDVLFTQVLPYMLHGEAAAWPMFNASIVGTAPLLHIGDPMTLAVRIAVAVVAIFAIAQRRRADIDRRLQIVEVAGILVLLTLLDNSFSWPTYGWLLLPLLVSVVSTESLLRTAPAWVAIYFFASPTDSVTPFASGDYGIRHDRFAAGFLGLLLVMCFGALKPATAWSKERRKGATGALWGRAARVLRPPPAYPVEEAHPEATAESLPLNST